MIGFLQGKVIFSDGHECILLGPSGVGHQIYFSHILKEGSFSSLYISHIIREDSEKLYGFKSLREKKLFELLNTVKGCGPKSSFSLINSLTCDQILNAIILENKSILTKVPGIGPKAASQMILDLKTKIIKIKMYSDNIVTENASYDWVKEDSLPSQEEILGDKETQSQLSLEKESAHHINTHQILDDTILACKELGFNEAKIGHIAQELMLKHEIQKPEQLIHLVLKEI